MNMVGMGGNPEGGQAGQLGTGGMGTAGIAGSGGNPEGGLAGGDGTGGQGGAPPNPTPIVCPLDPSPAAAILADADPSPADANLADADAAAGACPCSRRSGSPPSTWCSAGDGTTVTLLMTPEGGRFELGGWQAKHSGANVQLDVPQGAVAEPTWITLTETTCPPPASYVDASPLYQFAPTDLVFARPIDVRIPFGTDQPALPGGGVSTPSNLAILQTAGASYERVADSYINAGFMQGSITHFGFIFAGYEKSPAQAACP